MIRARKKTKERFHTAKPFKNFFGEPIRRLDKFI